MKPHNHRMPLASGGRRTEQRSKSGLRLPVVAVVLGALVVLLSGCITSFSPTSGPTLGGTTVVIKGSLFTGATAVKFGTTTATSFTVTGPGTITAVTNRHGAGTVIIKVTTPEGTYTSTTHFMFVTPPTGGNCTDPTYHTTNPEGADNTDPGPPSPEYWWVNNDAWNGTHGPQNIYVCNQSSWFAVSNQPDETGAVETYPDTEYDVGGRDAGTTTPISAFKAITSTFSEAYPSAGGWDAAYDLWLNNWSTEIMIWNQWAGTQSYWPNQAKTAVTLGGTGYKFLNNGGELMFFRDTQVSSGSVNILDAFKWLVAEGIVKATAVPTQLEYGVEICYTSGTETFPLNGLTFTVTP